MADAVEKAMVRAHAKAAVEPSFARRFMLVRSQGRCERPNRP